MKGERAGKWMEEVVAVVVMVIGVLRSQTNEVREVAVVILDGQRWKPRQQ